MNVIDLVAPRRSPNGRRRFTKGIFAKTTFYVSVALFLLFVAVATILWADDTTIPEIPATRTSEEVVEAVKVYLQNKDHRGFLKQDEPSSCWNEFEDRMFSSKYLLQGSWQVNAFYSKVRYYWRVDDLTLEVTVDDWLKTYIQTIDC